MSRYSYGNGNNYYDPVGSQQNQPTGYTSGGTSTTSASSYPSAATSNYQSGTTTRSAYQYGNQYGAQQPQQQQQQQGYGSTAPATTGNSTNRAAAALSSLSGQLSAASTTANNTAYDGSSWGSAGYGSYGSNLQMPNRTQSNNSPLNATPASSSTFGRLSVPEQTQSSSNYATQGYQAASRQSATPSNQSYQTAYTQPAQTQATQQPQRYNSPLHAVQARSHSKQASRSSNHGASNRQPSASVEPSPTTMTVNPSQVYDDRAERQRKAQIEAEKRRKREEQEAARKAEEDRVAAEKRKEEEEKQKEEKEAAMKKAESEQKAEQRKKARAEKRQSKNAATALQKMASSGGPSTEEAPLNDEEAEMKAMFQKMREFNAKNPAMLAKLWEEERRTHASPPQPAAATPAPAPAPGAQKTGSTGVRTFQKPPQPKAPAQKPATPATPTIHAQASTSLWPPQKKGTLAEAAAKWLMNLPENAARRMTRDEIKQADILKILESNPSYVQLCEALEGRGLRFERSSLARELLRAVPDGMKAQVGQNPPPAPAGPLSAVNHTAPQVNGSPDTPKKRGRPKKEDSANNAGTVSYETPRFTSLTDAAREIYAPQVALGGPVQPPQPQQVQAPPPPSVIEQTPALNGGNRAPSQSQPPEIKPEVKPEEPRRPPANKEEAARKRTFGDLVNLTTGDSDDEGPPKKMFFPMPQPELANGTPRQQLPSPAPGTGHFGIIKPMNANEFYKRPQQAAKPTPSVPWSALPPMPNQIPSNAPTPQPQSQLAPQPPKPKGPTAEQLQQDRVRGKMLVEPVMRDRVARKSKYDSRSIARDVLLATGRHPDMRPLNSHLNTMAKLLGDHGGFFEVDGTRGNRADLSTIRWEIIDPGEPAKVGVKKPADVANEEDLEDADDEDEAPARVVRQAVDNGDGTVNYVSAHEQLTGKPKIKRRGRPPRSSMPDTMTLTNGEGVRQSVTLGSGRDASTPNRQVPAQQRTPALAPTGGALVGYAAFRQIDENGNVVKKKGRPFGWRKSVHSREAQGLTPPKPVSTRGPSKLKQSNKPDELVEPKYQVYKCQWKGCGSELHNLDTLKKHVVKNHGKPNGDRVFECLWEGCEAATPTGKGKAKVSSEEGPVAAFPDLHRWMEHVDKSHLQPVAWELGDGPRGGMSDTASPRL